MALTAILIGLAPPAEAQQYKPPTGISHFVQRPGQDLAEVEELRGWTVGFGAVWASADRAAHGLAVHGTYGGAFWYWALSLGAGLDGSPEFETPALGLTYHYNALQSGDHRTRIGPQFGWTAPLGDVRRSVFDYRVVATHALDGPVVLYGGLGGETRRPDAESVSGWSTHFSMLAGLSLEIGLGVALSVGAEEVFSNPHRFRIATALQFAVGPSQPSGCRR